MTPDLFIEIGMDPALRLLPPQMDSPAARAFVLCVCFHESELTARRQKGGGPARGYPQFEKAGVSGVFTHNASRTHASTICAILDIKPVVATVHSAIEFNDILAVAFSRLLLWTVPDPLPHRGQPDVAWEQYLFAWRPGAVLTNAEDHPDRIALRQKWFRNFAKAWDIVAPVYNSEGEHSS